MTGARNWLDSNGFKGSDFFAWPLADDNPTTTAIVGKFASVGRHTCWQSMPATLPPDRPLRLRSMVTSTVTLAQAQAVIDKAYAAGVWVVFTIHKIRDTGATGGTEMSTSPFNSIVD